jgi:predicted  nucleic acid-binding Zn-ribbon protein
MENLAALQEIQLRDGISAETPKVKKLRAQVPESILAHFERLIARGKKGVALVHAGVCSECHLRLSSGTLGSLAHTEEIHKCDNCGRYLLLPENEPVVLTSATRPRKSGAKPLAHAL